MSPAERRVFRLVIFGFVALCMVAIVTTARERDAAIERARAAEGDLRMCEEVLAHVCRGETYPCEQ